MSLLVRYLLNVISDKQEIDEKKQAQNLDDEQQDQFQSFSESRLPQLCAGGILRILLGIVHGGTSESRILSGESYANL